MNDLIKKYKFLKLQAEKSFAWNLWWCRSTDEDRENLHNEIVDLLGDLGIDEYTIKTKIHFYTLNDQLEFRKTFIEKLNNLESKLILQKLIS